MIILVLESEYSDQSAIQHGSPVFLITVGSLRRNTL